MEKVCEFCKALRPVVYCKADAAYLCLSCDAKVHSANALFNRHLRTLLCDSCRYHPAYAQCLDHRMLMCRGCDRCLHEVSSHHQKRVVNSYLGCPSAKDFASLWGFEFGELDKSVVKDQLVSTSCSSVQPSASKFDIPGKSCQQIGRSSRKSRVSRSTLVSGAESEVGSGNRQSELWSQNMQDLGVCEDIISHDDYNIPDVDKTFCNFEELFGGDQDPIGAFLDENDLSCSFIEKDMPLEKSNNSDGGARKDASVASSVYISCSVHIDNDKDPYNQACNFPGSLDSPQTIRSPYSRYSISRHGAESRSDDHLDSELSPYISHGEASCHSPDLEGAHTDAHTNAMMRYTEKKRARMQDKQIRYTPRKPKNDVRKRGNG